MQECFAAVTSLYSQYVAELSMLEVDPFLHYFPSVVAAAAFCLANYTLNRSLWVRHVCLMAIGLMLLC